MLRSIGKSPGNLWRQSIYSQHRGYIQTKSNRANTGSFTEYRRVGRFDLLSMLSEMLCL